MNSRIRQRPRRPGGILLPRLAAVLLVVAGCASRNPQEIAAMPDLSARKDGCHEPSPTTGIVMDSTLKAAAGQLIVAVRSTHDTTWRGDYHVVMAGPIGGPLREWKLESSGAAILIDDLSPGRYVVRSWAVGHYGRVDTISVPEAGLSVIARVDLTPSHWCGFPGNVIVKGAGY